MAALTSADWQEQLVYQARWIAEDLFPDYNVGFHSNPVGQEVRLYDEEDNLLALVWDSCVVFAGEYTPEGLNTTSTWDEITTYCNSLVD